MGEIFGITFKGEKDLIAFIIISVFWMLVINNISTFLNVVDNLWKFVIYSIGVFVTYRIWRSQQ